MSSFLMYIRHFLHKTEDPFYREIIFPKNPTAHFATVCEEGPGICALIMTIGSLLLIVVSLPVSLLFVVKVVQEYERAVIFR